MNILKYFDLRYEQLEIQIKIDKKLMEYSNKCPNTIIEFLIYERELNRKQTLKLKESSLLDSINILDKNIKDITDHQKKVINLLDSYDICNELKLFLNNQYK